jgi:N-acetyl-beta-hexosaminidase
MILMILTVGLISRAPAAEVSSLRLVPYPKKVSLQEGTFSLDRALVLEAPAESAGLIGRLIGEELKRAGCKAPEVRPIEGGAKFLWLAPMPAQQRPSAEFRRDATPEHYVLTVQPDAVVGASPGEAGVLYAAQTLCQLVRANRIEKTKLPCLAIGDWPALRWRCFQDDGTNDGMPEHSAMGMA